MRRIFAGMACRLCLPDFISPLPSPVCGIFALICWLYLIDVITHSFTFFFIILTCWAIQVQVLLQVRSFDFPAPVSRLFADHFFSSSPQIIVNRICILVASPTNRFKLKYGVAAFILAIQISVYCIWIPARLQISAHYEDVNRVWDRCEKIIYLIVDAGESLPTSQVGQADDESDAHHFELTQPSTSCSSRWSRPVSLILDLRRCAIVPWSRGTRARLTSDLTFVPQYDSLLTFNKRIIAVSLAMDVLIIGQSPASRGARTYKLTEALCVFQV